MTTSRRQAPQIILMLLVLGLLHAIIVVQSFTSPAGGTKKTTSTTAADVTKTNSNPSSLSIIRPSSRNRNNNPLLSNASSWYHHRSSTSSSSSSSSASSSSFSSSSLRSSVVEETTEVASDGLPEFGSDGLYHIENPDEYKALLDANPDKLIILKVFAPWCKACKGLAPKFQALSKDVKYQNLPIIWASLNILGNKDFVKSIGVLALPTVQFYAGNGLKVDTFPCGPSKVPILKRKLVQLVNENVDAKTRQLKTVVAESSSTAVAADSDAAAVKSTTGATKAPTTITKEVPATVNATRYNELPTPTKGEETQTTIQQVVERERSMLRRVNYMSHLLESDFDKLLSKASLITFEAGSIIMREGNMGRTFYVIVDGEVELCQRTSFEDPLTTPPSYLGTVINQCTKKGEFFGERSLITGEPRAASIRALRKTTCFAFDQNDFPKTSILHGFDDSLIDDATKKREMDEINTKYHVPPSISVVNDRIYNATQVASQKRGSVNTPEFIAGVDSDAAVEDDDDDESSKVVKDPSTLGIGTETMVPLLMRLKLIRSITRCFEYVKKYDLRFGDPGSRRRRNILLNSLSPMQKTYIDDAFLLIDEDKSELINLNEIKRIVNSIGDSNEIGLGSDDKIMDMIIPAEDSTTTTKNKYAPWRRQNTTDTATTASMYAKKITKEDFVGLMAESETYHLFLETFQTLDRNDSGFVRAKDLNRILCGVRDLISDDHKSIIDVEDSDMVVDYEIFSRMLVGTPLIS